MRHSLTEVNGWRLKKEKKSRETSSRLTTLVKQGIGTILVAYHGNKVHSELNYPAILRAGRFVPSVHRELLMQLAA